MNRDIFYKSVAVIFVLSVALFMGSCKIKKNTVKEKSLTENRKDVSAILINSGEKYNNLQYRFNGKVNFLEEEYNLNGIIRLKRDSLIWMSVRLSVGIEAARIIILKDSIKLASKITSTYISEKISFFEQITNVKMNYSLLEAILTNSLINSDKSLYRVVSGEGDQDDVIKRINTEFMENYIVPIEFQRISEMFYSDGNNEIRVNYDEFEDSNYGLFSGMMNIIMQSEKDCIRARIKISNIEFDKKGLKFPFKEK